MGLFDLVVTVLQELLNDVLNILADIARFGQRGRICNDEGHIKQTGQGLGQQSLARAGRPDEQNIALGELYFILFGSGRRALVAQPLVVVVNRNRKRSLGPNLTDNILIKDREDFVWGG